MSGYKTAIYTLNIPLRENDIFQYCMKSIAKYADKVKADFIMRTSILDHVLSDETDYKNVIMEKFYIKELLKYYDRVLYVDADVLIRPDAPNIFEWCLDQSALYLYNEVKFNNVDYDKYIEKVKQNIKWTHADNGRYDFYNAGVMLASRDCSKAFEFIEEEYFIMEDLPMIVDQPYLFHNILKHNITIKELDKRFNTMVYFEDNGWFLHFANILDRKDRIQKYL